MDPWEDEDPLDPPHDEAVVQFPGVPDVEVHVYGDLADTVTVEEYIDFETPRPKTLALVEALLSGAARIRPNGGAHAGFLKRLVQAPFGVVLVVPVKNGELYAQRVAFRPNQSWLLSLSVEE